MQTRLHVWVKISQKKGSWEPIHFVSACQPHYSSFSTITPSNSDASDLWPSLCMPVIFCKKKKNFFPPTQICVRYSIALFLFSFVFLYFFSFTSIFKFRTAKKNCWNREGRGSERGGGLNREGAEIRTSHPLKFRQDYVERHSSY